MPIATNPYHMHGPLETGSPFIGQEALFAWIEEGLKAGESLLAIYGLPKMGKTSFLRRLPARLSGGYLFVYSQVSPHEPWQAEKGLAQLAQDIWNALRTAGRSWDGAPASLWAGLPEVLRDVTLLVMIDGLSLYAQRPEVWSPLLSTLAELTQCVRGRAVLAIEGVPAQAQTDPESALAKLPGMMMAYLTEPESRELLIQTAGGRLHYDYDAIAAIHQWTGGHPYFVQVFGHVAFDLVGHVGRVDIHTVNKATGQVLDLADSAFQYFWDSLAPPARAVLSVLGERHGRHELFTSQDVQSFLRWQRVQISPEDLANAISELMTKGILRKLGVQSYRVEIKLWRQWLAQRKPLHEVIRETRVFKQEAPPRVAKPPREPIRWLSVLSWALSAVIVLLIIWTWQSRGQPAQPLAPPATSTAQAFAPSPSPMPGQRHIAYARGEHPDSPWQIVVASSDGAEPRPLTTGADRNTSPSWSPDGKRILFVSNREGNEDIWIMEATGKNSSNLTAHPADDRTPAWSPQGDAIAFASYRDGNWEIYLMGTDGSRPRRLTDHEAADLAPTWSPDGRWLAFASHRDGNWELYIMDSEGAQLRRLTDNEATDFAPAWSPRGDLIAFESYRDGDMEIYVISPDGSYLANLTNEPVANDHRPAWSPDGTMLLYHSNRDGGWDIFRMNADGSGKLNLTQSETLEQEPAWQP